MKKDLLERLEEYCGADYVPLHMPGAKRNTQEFVMPNPYAIDITEIDGFDNMHHAEDILKEAFERTAKLFGAEESLWLINGSSAGLLAAICGATKKNDTVLVARNCHRAVYNAIYLNELNPVYLYPKEVTSGIYGAVSPSQVEQAFKQHENIRAVIITSPTYEGIVSDVKKIAEIVLVIQLSLRWILQDFMYSIRKQNRLSLTNLNKLRDMKSVEMVPRIVM